MCTMTFTLVKGYDTPLGHGQQLRELSSSNKVVELSQILAMCR